MSKRNLDEKFKDLQSALEDRHHQWFAHYLVEELAKSQPNYQGMYLQLLDNFNEKVLWAEVLRETYISCQKMLNAQSTMDSPQERTSLKNLAGWLGSLTLARNLPILHRNISFKDLLLEANDTQRLLIAIPFTCKVLVHAAKSKIFRPPNPWLMELLGFLAELYHFMDLKLNQKFEIEVLCKELSLDVSKIEPLEVIRARPLMPPPTDTQFFADGGPDGFGDMHLMGLSKRPASERFSPEAVIQALPDLGNMLQIPTAAGNVTQPQLRNIFITAAQQAIFEIIAPVVERSVTIAAISTAELIQKDFAAESDVEKLSNAAHTMVKSLSGSLALVTCKEPLRMSIMNNIRILALQSLPGQLPEGQILMFVNDNIDTVCSLVENAAEEHSISEADAQLAQAIEQRRQHNEQKPTEHFNQPPLTRWSQLIAPPFSQELGGLTRQQQSLYENFGRQARMQPTVQSGSMADATATRSVQDVLAGTGDFAGQGEGTPLDMPAMPRETPQQQRLQMQAPPGQQMNGYADAQNIGQTIRSLLDNLQQACREATEEHITEFTADSQVRRIFDELLALVDGSVQREQLFLATGQETLMRVYTDTQKRLEVDVLIRFLFNICRMSVNALRGVTSFLATLEDDKAFNAPVTVALLDQHLMEIEYVDALTAKALKLRREVALPYLNDLISEILLGDSAVEAYRSDFSQCYEELSYWLAEQPNNELGRQVLAKLQHPADQVNGMPSPPGSDKHDQLEYIFDEWIHLQRKCSPARAQVAFVQQLHQKHICVGGDEAGAFFRSCLEISVAAYERASALPYTTIDNAHLHTDAYAKLIAIMVAYQNPADGGHARPAKFFAAILRLISMLFNKQYREQGDRFPSRVYFRLFSSMLCEMNTLREQLGEDNYREILQTFGSTFEVLQPKFFEGFAFGWLSLVSHRLFLPVMLKGPGRITGGWDTFIKLFGAMFQFFSLVAAQGEANGSLRDFYPGICRLMLMLHRDFPEFLIENHAVLNAMIPERVSQLHNLINSAATQSVVADQPDPFERGLKINRLEQVRQPPAIYTDHTRILRDAGMLDNVEKALNGSVDEIEAVVATLGTAATVDTFLINVIILHIGVQATSGSSVFSAGAPAARLLERLLNDTRPETRFHIMCAITNQLRYVNGHTHYFSTALVHFFSVGSDDLRQSLMNVFVNRLSMARPHPWGLLVTMLELIKNPAYDIWGFGWIKAHPTVETMLMTLVQHQERMPVSVSPLRSMA